VPGDQLIVSGDMQVELDQMGSLRRHPKKIQRSVPLLRVSTPMSDAEHFVWTSMRDGLHRRQAIGWSGHDGIRHVR
jgi:hypothetical protein